MERRELRDDTLCCVVCLRRACLRVLCVVSAGRCHIGCSSSRTRREQLLRFFSCCASSAAASNVRFCCQHEITCKVERTLIPTCMKSTAISIPNSSPLKRVKLLMRAHALPSARPSTMSPAQAQTQAIQGRKRAAPRPPWRAAKA